MRTQTERDYRQRILRVLVHIQNHLDDVQTFQQTAQSSNGGVGSGSQQFAFSTYRPGMTFGTAIAVMDCTLPPSTDAAGAFGTSTLDLEAPGAGLAARWAAAAWCGWWRRLRCVARPLPLLCEGEAVGAE